MIRALQVCLAACLCAALLGCATRPEAPATAPPLRLSPASLGANLALQQQLTAMVGSQTHRMELLLEVDAQAVRLAVLSLGQTAARLEWDGVRLTQSRAAWWPEAVTAQRILDDLQLTLWPADAIRTGLPAGWSLDSSATLRILSREGEPVIRIRYEGPYASELEHLRDGYRVRVASRVLGASP